MQVAMVSLTVRALVLALSSRHHVHGWKLEACTKVVLGIPHNGTDENAQVQIRLRRKSCDDSPQKRLTTTKERFAPGIAATKISRGSLSRRAIGQRFVPSVENSSELRRSPKTKETCALVPGVPFPPPCHAPYIFEGPRRVECTQGLGRSCRALLRRAGKKVSGSQVRDQPVRRQTEA